MAIVSIKSRSVGPAHDPYHREILTITEGDRKVEWVTCALMGQTISFYERQPGQFFWAERREVEVRQVWKGATQAQSLVDTTKAAILSRRWVGMDYESAMERINEQEAEDYRARAGAPLRDPCQA